MSSQTIWHRSLFLICCTSNIYASHTYRVWIEPMQESLCCLRSSGSLSSSCQTFSSTYILLFLFDRVSHWRLPQNFNFLWNHLQPLNTLSIIQVWNLCLGFRYFHKIFVKTAVINMQLFLKFFLFYQFCFFDIILV
jgi:hypothetical protein